MRPRRSRPDTGEPFVFVSYSHLDDEFRKRLDTHMAQMRREGMQTWFDGDIRPGGELDPEIMWALKRADIFVALASPNYLASSYCFEKEYGFALRKAARKKLHLIVVLLRQCQWRHTKMARYKLLPHDAKAVDKWARRGDAWENVVSGIQLIVNDVRAEQAASPKRKPPAMAKPKASPRAETARRKLMPDGGRQPTKPTAKGKAATALKVARRKPLNLRPTSPGSRLRRPASPQKK